MSDMSTSFIMLGKLLWSLEKIKTGKEIRKKGEKERKKKKTRQQCSGTPTYKRNLGIYMYMYENIEKIYRRIRVKR